MSFDLAYLAAMVTAVALMGISKGGFAGLGMLALPIMALVVPPVQAAAIMLPLLIAQDVVSVWSYRRDFDRRTLACMLPGALLGIAAGWLLAARVSDVAVGAAVGAISIGFGLRRLLGGAGMRKAQPARFLPGTIWGAAAGFTSMIAHAGGPPFQIFVLPQRLPPAVFVGTGAIFFAIVNLLKVGPYLALGQFSTANLAASAALFPLAIATTFFGVWLVRRIDAQRFYVIVDLLLILIGAKLVWSGLAAVFG